MQALVLGTIHAEIVEVDGARLLVLCKTPIGKVLLRLKDMAQARAAASHLYTRVAIDASVDVADGDRILTIGDLLAVEPITEKNESEPAFATWSRYAKAIAPQVAQFKHDSQ